MNELNGLAVRLCRPFGRSGRPWICALVEAVLVIAPFGTRLSAQVTNAPLDLATDRTRFSVDTMDRHIHFTPSRQPSSADSARATEVAKELRQALEKYRDPARAVADGFKQFPLADGQPLYHFGNAANFLLEMTRFDPARPSFLLYKPDASGKLRLIGAMYDAPDTSTLDALDRRVPLSIAHWHRHVNQCLPKPTETIRGRDERDGRPIFGPNSLIATRAECDAIGGVFQEAIDPWMLHAYVYEGDDLAVVWSADNGMSGHSMHPPGHMP